MKIGNIVVLDDEERTTYNTGSSNKASTEQTITSIPDNPNVKPPVLPEQLTLNINIITDLNDPPPPPSKTADRGKRSASEVIPPKRPKKTKDAEKLSV